MDTKGPYTVQTARLRISYYNYLLTAGIRLRVLAKSREVAVEAFDEVVDYLQGQYEEILPV